MYTPAKKSGKANKFVCPYKGPYQVLQLYDNGTQVKLVSDPNSQSIRVAVNHVRLCPTEITDKEGSGSSELSKEGSPPARTGSAGQPERSPEVEDIEIENVHDYIKSETSDNQNSVERKDPWFGRLQTKVDHQGR